MGRLSCLLPLATHSVKLCTGETNYEKEIAGYDYAKVAQNVSNGSGQASTAIKKPAIVLRKKIVQRASGAC